ncbi:MAG TPA: PP2C family serine/threonine-protein phosphatase [Polyangium sp.]|nr:PP2C family serine/threonine-protein phosphatase [Polyangium sp.]
MTQPFPVHEKVLLLEPKRRIRAAGHKVIGAKHLREGRPCQDDLRIEQDGAALAVVVADGHGSSAHAEVGARIAVEITTKALFEFAANLRDEQRSDPRSVHGLAQDPFRRLLVREWVRQVHEHAGSDTVDLKDYGTTLLFALVTRDFILFGQLGDGDILVIDDVGTVSRPLPQDPACFADETSSLSLPDAATSLRVMVLPLPEFETLLLLSTDGYSKSYATDADFERIAPDYIAMVRDDGLFVVANALHGFLTTVTTDGSGDDIAFGMVHIPTDFSKPQYTLEVLR